MVYEPPETGPQKDMRWLFDKRGNIDWLIDCNDDFYRSLACAASSVVTAKEDKREELLRSFSDLVGEYNQYATANSKMSVQLDKSKVDVHRFAAQICWYICSTRTR